jgi:hypothetical protein
VYLLNPLKAKSAAHYWDGKDTLCRMYSTGGLSKLKQQIFNDPMGKPICSMCVNVQRKTSMQAKPKVEMCANRFELCSRWGEPIDKEWALRVFNVWLDQRMDLTQPTVYDAVIPQKGDEHGQQ